MKDLTLEDFPEIKNEFREIEFSSNFISVSNGIKTGNLLLRLKSYVPRGQWEPFIEKNLKLSKRTCQCYMRLAKANINECFWHLGMQKLHELLSNNCDLTKKGLNHGLKID